MSEISFGIFFQSQNFVLQIIEDFFCIFRSFVRPILNIDCEDLDSCKIYLLQPEHRLKICSQLKFLLDFFQNKLDNLIGTSTPVT
jgi:hypothetical protein